MDQTGPNQTEVDILDRIEQMWTVWNKNGQNEPNRTKVYQIARIGLKWTKVDKMDQIEPKCAE